MDDIDIESFEEVSEVTQAARIEARAHRITDELNAGGLELFSEGSFFSEATEGNIKAVFVHPREEFDQPAFNAAEREPCNDSKNVYFLNILAG
jgi:hypothetical protein